jgi:hypothetical protein
VIAWADLVLDAGRAAALEAVLAEVPKEAARTLVTSRQSPEVEQLAERYVRRAGRIGAVAHEAEGVPTELRYATVTPASRPSALRRVLDDLDPETAAVFARSDEAAREVEEQIRALGYRGEPSVVLVREAKPAAAAGEAGSPAAGPAPGGALLVLYELPSSRSELRALAGDAAPAVVALVQPRELGTLRWLAAQGRVSPLTLAGPAARARSREEVLRDELRAALADGAPARELLTLEPLLDEYDGIEIAELRRPCRPAEEPCASSSTSGAATTPRPATSSARSPARPGSRATRSARSTCATRTRWSRSRPMRPSEWSTRSAAW